MTLAQFLRTVAPENQESQIDVADFDDVSSIYDAIDDYDYEILEIVQNFERTAS